MSFPAVNTKYQRNLALMQALTIAANNRLHLHDVTGVDVGAVEAGTIVEDWVQSMQDRLSAFCWVNAINPASTTLDLTTSQSYPTCFASFTDACIAAGLPNGFRRVPGDWPPYQNWTSDSDSAYTAHGFAQAGDMLGPWLFADILALINTMTTYLIGVQLDQTDRGTAGKNQTQPPTTCPSDPMIYTIYSGTYNGKNVRSINVSSNTPVTGYWGADHERYTYQACQSLGAVSKTVKLIGRLGTVSSSDDYWDINGDQNDNTHIIHDFGQISDSYPATDWIGGARQTNLTDCFAGIVSPDSGTYKVWSSKFSDLKMLVTITD